MSNLSDFKNRTESQLIEYAVRMRKERDEALRDRDSARNRIQELMRFFREVDGRVYFDGHYYSEHHGLVRLNEAGKHLMYWGND